MLDCPFCVDGLDVVWLEVQLTHEVELHCHHRIDADGREVVEEHFHRWVDAHRAERPAAEFFVSRAIIGREAAYYIVIDVGEGEFPDFGNVCRHFFHRGVVDLKFDCADVVDAFPGTAGDFEGRDFTRVSHEPFVKVFGVFVGEPMVAKY